MHWLGGGNGRGWGVLVESKLRSTASDQGGRYCCKLLRRDLDVDLVGGAGPPSQGFDEAIAERS